MNVYTLLTSMTEGLKRNIYVKFELYDVPGMQTESTSLKEWLDKDMEKILQAKVVNFNIEPDKNYGYFMLTIVISM